MMKQGDDFDRTDAAMPASHAETDADAQPTKVIEPLDADAQQTEAYDFDATPPAEAADRRGLSRGARVWITITAIVLGLVVVAVVADMITRSIAEQRVAEELEANLPDGVEGDIDVSIGGFSVIGQYLTGTMQRVELDAPKLTVEGAPLDVAVVAEGVPVDFAKPVRHLTASIDATEDSVNQLITVADIDAGFTLGEGTIGYDDSITVFGFPIRYAVTARPIAAGDRVLLEPDGVDVSAGGTSIDLSGIIDRLLGGDPLEVCVADRLPEGVEVSGITIVPGVARVDLEARDLILDEAHLEQPGTCS